MIKGSTLQPMRCTGVPGSWVVIWCHTSAHLGNPEPSKFCEDRRSINDNTHAQPHDRPETNEESLALNGVHTGRRPASLVLLLVVVLVLFLWY